jgi:hypothetical protein
MIRAASLSAIALLASAVCASASDRTFFKSVEGQWAGPGEIVAGKYKGTKFNCTFAGSTPSDAVGMTLDGGCRVGLFTQKMSATVKQKGRSYTGSFMDGSEGKGLDVVSGAVTGNKVVFGLNRAQLNGAMLARMAGPDSMNVTVSVRVDDEMVPVIGVALKRVDGQAVGAIAAE